MRTLHISRSNDIVNVHPLFATNIIDHLSLSNGLNFLFGEQIKSALFMIRINEKENT